MPQVRVHDLKHTFGRRLGQLASASKTGKTFEVIAPRGSQRTPLQPSSPG